MAGGGDTIVPESWIKMPVQFEIFPPVLSIIIYVENNFDTIETAMKSIFTQNFNDFEIIVVTSEMDASGIFARRYSGNPNVTVLNIGRDENKFAAWNLGLKNSRGEYVMFLTGKNFIFPTTIRMVADAWDFAFKNSEYTERGDNYVNSGNYNKIGADIICGVHQIFEDENGLVNVQGIENKKFSILADVQFQNIPRFVYLKVDGNEADRVKLSAVANRQINSAVETKIFRHDFLNKNKICFNENIECADLEFWSSAILSTDKIILTSDIFLGTFK